MVQRGSVAEQDDMGCDLLTLSPHLPKVYESPQHDKERVLVQWLAYGLLIT